VNLPGVGLLLDVDREYREKAAAGLLQKIAPRFFNPGNEAWLPVLHTRFGPWRFTALYSNTERAHDLYRTHDWVVIHFDDDESQGRSTVVTEYHGALKGRRVVRGRERECAAHYRAQARVAELEAAI
jgi:putative hydrolase